ncbi:MAG: protein kinase [Planctomycetia bacterium]|nr:protein kinase [Planctomycetia bacterium]
MRITLTVIEGPDQGRQFHFDGRDFFLVGRSSKAHFQLPRTDRMVSRVHFLVEVNPPRCRLLDMNSHNGTFVNNQKVPQADLSDGDRIKVGKTTLQIAVDISVDDHEADTPPPVEVPPPVPAKRQSSLKLPPLAVSAPPPSAPVNVAPPSAPVRTPPSEPTAPLAPSSFDQPHPAGAERCRACGAAPAPAPPKTFFAPLCAKCQDKVRQQLQPFPGYQIVEVLGQGGMGIVHQAIGTNGEVVALKSFLPHAKPSPHQVKRFLREVNTLRKLNHPYIVGFREFGDVNGKLYCAMELVQGTDAGKVVSKQGPLAPKRAVRLICQLLEALHYAHGLGLVHRDIKPANLLVTQNQGQESVKLADFGLAREYQASMMSGLTTEGELGGTIAFMPPEQITDFHGVGPAADQYSASAALYNLLTNRYVYDLPPKDIRRQLSMILQDEPVPIHQRRPDLNAELATIIHRALSREPNYRYASAGDMRKALAKFE